MSDQWDHSPQDQRGVPLRQNEQSQFTARPEPRLADSVCKEQTPVVTPASSVPQACPPNPQSAARPAPPPPPIIPALEELAKTIRLRLLHSKTILLSRVKVATDAIKVDWQRRVHSRIAESSPIAARILFNTSRFLARRWDRQQIASLQRTYLLLAGCGVVVLIIGLRLVGVLAPVESHESTLPPTMATRQQQVERYATPPSPERRDKGASRMATSDSTASSREETNAADFVRNVQDAARRMDKRDNPDNDPVIDAMIKAGTYKSKSQR
jgi:hypothetical protein